MKGIYIVGGYPDISRFRDAFVEVADAGYDFIEVGIPFNDPVADGPVIAGAINDTVKRGITVDSILDEVAGLRDLKIKKYFMTYSNIIFSYGISKFSKRIENVIDGVIIADLPNRMSGYFYDNGFDVPIVPFATLETRDSDIEIIKNSRCEFIYFVGVRGVTGSSANLQSEELISGIERLKKLTDKKIIIGFGIKSSSDVKQAMKLADGFVAGTEAVKRQGDSVEFRKLLNSLI